jgi:hypothetical protein
MNSVIVFHYRITYDLIFIIKHDINFILVIQRACVQMYGTSCIFPKQAERQHVAGANLTNVNCEKTSREKLEI